jgi:glycosyltransferase involved in cell wall biosynthesis
MKKILLINNGYPSKKNKQYTAYIKSIKESLEESGQTVDLLVMYADFSNKYMKIISYFKYYLKLLFFNSYNNYDYIYINNYPHSFLPLIFKLKKMNNLIIHWHGTDIFYEKFHTKLLNNLSYKFIPKNCLHISPSTYFAAVISKTLNIKQEDIFISASGGVDTEIFTSNRNEKSSINIGFASNVSKEKGFGLFALLINRIDSLEKEIHKKVHFHYIDYGEEKEIYKKEFISNNHVKIHSLYSKNKMPDFYAQIDILLLPSSRKAESLGLVSLEAMSCNVPVVGTDAFAVKEYILEHQTGERFEIGDYDKMKQAIIRIVNNYEEYNPRDFIIKNYSKQIVSNGYKEYFNDK